MLKDDINKNILKTILSEISNINNNKNIVPSDIISNKSISTVEKNITVEFVDDNNEIKKALRKEIIKIYPIDNYNMYEVLVTISTLQDSIKDISDAFYTLVMLTPNNKMINCEFIDLSLFSEKSSEECDNYQNVILNEAKKYISDAKDIEALKSFIELFRITDDK